MMAYAKVFQDAKTSTRSDGNYKVGWCFFVVLSLWVIPVTIYMVISSVAYKKLTSLALILKVTNGSTCDKTVILDCFCHSGIISFTDFWLCKRTFLLDLLQCFVFLNRPGNVKCITSWVTEKSFQTVTFKTQKALMNCHFHFHYQGFHPLCNF